MLTLPFPFLDLSKSLHRFSPILYCGYGHSAVGSIGLIKQCFASKLQTFKMSTGDMYVLCLCFSLSQVYVFPRAHSPERTKKPHKSK